VVSVRASHLVGWRLAGSKARLQHSAHY
jgi:hypothetical protein